MMWISSLPSSVLAWCLSPFLTDTDAITVATCSKESFDAMKRAPYSIKKQLWWMDDEAIAQLPLDSPQKSGADVWLSSPRVPQFRIGQLRRALVYDAYDALRVTSLIESLPTSVNELEVKSSYTLPAMGLPNPIVYPSHITSLILDGVTMSEESAPLALPPSLRTLALPYCPYHIRWQDFLTALPESLHTLDLSYFAYQRSLKGLIFPPYLTDLNMGQWTGPIAELSPLPTGLRTLTLPAVFHGVHELAKRLPSSLTELFFDNSIGESLDDVEWPPAIRSMRFSCGFRKPPLNWRPPPALETLDLFWNWPLRDLRLPATLQRLTLWALIGPIPSSYCWPPTLRALRLHSIQCPLPDVQWPDSLEELELSTAWNLPCHQLRLPPRLRKLRFGEEFNQSVAELELPSTLEWLGFGNSFNQPVEGVLRLPMRLQQLHFGSGTHTDKFNQSLANMEWPSSLQSLFLPMSLKLRLEGLPRLLPPSLRALHRFESADANIESAWTTIVTSLPRCEMILRPLTYAYPSPQQKSFQSFD